MNAPMLIPVAGLITGILSGILGAGVSTGLVISAISIFIYLVLIHFSKDPLKGFRVNYLHHLWIFLIFTSIGIIDMDFNRPTIEIPEIESIIGVEGHVNTIYCRTSGDKAEISVNKLILSSGKTIKVNNLKVLLKSDALECSSGDDVVIPSPLEKIQDSPNYFSNGYTRRQNNQGFFFETQCNGSQIQIIGQSGGIRELAGELREKLTVMIESTHLAKSTQNILITVLLGDRSYLQDDTRLLFSDGGLSHILALSGMHVAMIAGILMFILFPLNFFGLYRYRMLIVAGLLILYAFITGLSPSIIRSTLMMLALVICIFLERKNSAWNALLLATFIILLFSPEAIFDIGMQLSFVCVASMIFFVRRLNPIDQRSHQKLYNISSAIISTLVATLASWCLCAYYFSTVPILFLIVNLIVLPLLPLYLVLAIFYIIFSAVGIEINGIATIVDKGPELLIEFLSKITNEGNSALHFTPSLTSLIIWFLFLVSCAILLNWKQTKAVYSIGITLLTLFVVSLFFNPVTQQDDFIVQTGAMQIKILAREKGKEIPITIKRSAISECKIAGKTLIAVDSPLESCKEKEFEESKLGHTAKEVDYILICSGSKSNLKDITAKYKPQCIIVHQSVRRTVESRLAESADSLGLRFHSIRESGPFRNGQPE